MFNYFVLKTDRNLGTVLGLVLSTDEFSLHSFGREGEEDSNLNDGGRCIFTAHQIKSFTGLHLKPAKKTHVEE